MSHFYLTFTILTLILFFSCTKSPGKIDVAIRKVDFGKVIVGESKLKTITISKFNDNIVEIYDYELSGSQKFSYQQEVQKDIKNSKGEVRGGVLLTFIFTPELPEIYTATITIISNDDDEEKIEVQLTGKGVTKEWVKENCDKCNTPPNSVCKNSAELVSFMPIGNCDDNYECVYPIKEIKCPFICKNSICTENPCTNVLCNHPPNHCFETIGVCKNGFCKYQFDNTKECNDSDNCSVNDICIDGECRGTVRPCDQPANECYSNAGKCIDGICIYDFNDGIACNTGDPCQPSGICSKGKCDTSIATRCETPVNVCYQENGTCNNGGCFYDYNNTANCDDNNPCTTNDTCKSGFCQGNTTFCTTKQINTCKDVNTAYAYNNVGNCTEAGDCDYYRQEVTCKYGCDSETGFCVGNPCEGVLCNTPPKPQTCYELIGVCDNGNCNFIFKQNDLCDDNNLCTINDTCDVNTCRGEPKICNNPPEKYCLSNNTKLRTYDIIGICNSTNGNCDYPFVDTFCPFGCENEKCKSDPCANVTCDNPPTACYKSTGTCNNGECFYSYDNGKVCDDNQYCTVGDTCKNGLCTGQIRTCQDIPSNICIDQNTLRNYNNALCNEANNKCDYGFNDTTCVFGCTDNVCNGDPCTGIFCMLSPDPQDCYQLPGTCSGSSCNYQFINNRNCNDSDPCTVNDICKLSSKTCIGTIKSCNTPPADICINNNQRRKYYENGICNPTNGVCDHGYLDSDCPFGCSNNQCNPDPCLLMTCNTPSISICVGDYTKREYSSVGTCTNGSCSYSSVDTPCKLDEYCNQGLCVKSCVLSNTKQISASSNGLDNPKIAFSGNEFGIVWEDSRSGHKQIIFRIANILGEPSGPEIKVTDHLFEAKNPSIIWNKTYQEFGIAWQDERDTNPAYSTTTQEIYFQRVSPTLGPIGTNVKLTSTNSLTRSPYITWSQASQYLISWETNYYQPNTIQSLEIFLMGIDYLGNKYLSDTRITYASNDSESSQVVFTGPDYLLSWLDSRNSGSSHVYSILTDRNGAPHSQEINANLGQTETKTFKAVYNENSKKILLTWVSRQTSSKPLTIYLKVFDDKFNVLVNTIQLYSNNTIGRNISILPVGTLSGPILNQYYIIWDETDNSNSTRKLKYIQVNDDASLITPNPLGIDTASYYPNKSISVLDNEGFSTVFIYNNQVYLNRFCN